jgi:hypothetical protein
VVVKIARVAAIALAWSATLAAYTPNSPRLIDTNGQLLPATAQLNSTIIEFADEPSLQTVTFAAGRDWPAIVLRADGAWDWSRAQVLTLDIADPTDRPVTLLLRIDDDAHATGDTHSFTGAVQLTPSQHTTLLLPLGTEETGMLAQPSGADPGHPGRTFIGQVHGRIDLHHVVALHISGVRTDLPVTLRLGDLHLVPDDGWQARYTRIADAYGQSTQGNWPEKVASDEDLRHHLQAAADAVARTAGSALPFADRYGGLPAPAGLHATGFFHVEQVGGRWRLVTPAGHAFFSIGVDAVAASGRTPVAGRAFMFADLPGPADPLARFYGPPGRQDWFDIYQANLARGLGPDWRALWPGQTLARLKAWGFNTLGNWSDADIAAAHALPYVTTLEIRGTYATVPMASGGRLPDPFDPRFADAVDDAVRDPASRWSDDPWLIGIFSGNELPWAGTGRPSERLAARVLLLGVESPAKQAFIARLQTDYGAPARLAAAWGVPPALSWEAALHTPLPLTDHPTWQSAADLSRFESAYAERYFRLVAQTLRRHDPKHLFLGSRFAGWSPEAAAACARWCDVLSFNIYARNPEQTAAAPLWHLLDKPVLIGEFHFGSRDRGSFWPGLVDVGSEDRRAPAYAAYLAMAAEDHQVVGAHWFKYADEPLTGRPWDGENGHIGLVSIADVPFASFTSAITDANRLVLQHVGQPGLDVVH